MIKLLEYNTGEYIHDHTVEKDFFDKTQNALTIKEKTRTWGSIKIINFSFIQRC